MSPTALVTGGNRGIGRAIAWALGNTGFDVAIVDRERTGETDATLDGIARAGRRASFVRCDIADIASHAQAVQAAWGFSERIDCLVNNAGVGVAQRGDLLDVTPQSFDRVMAVNLRGAFFFTQAVARRMVAAGPASATRSIITISSSNAEIASPDRAEYCMAKAGLAMMTRLLAVRLAAEGIVAYDIRPGVIRTDMTRPATEKYDRLIAEGLSPIARWGEPEDVGRVVATLALGALPFVTGDAIHVDGGLHIHKF